MLPRSCAPRLEPGSGNPRLGGRGCPAASCPCPAPARAPGIAVIPRVQHLPEQLSRGCSPVLSSPGSRSRGRLGTRAVPRIPHRRPAGMGWAWDAAQLLPLPGSLAVGVPRFNNFFPDPVPLGCLGYGVAARVLPRCRTSQTAGVARVPCPPALPSLGQLGKAAPCFCIRWSGLGVGCAVDTALPLLSPAPFFYGHGDVAGVLLLSRTLNSRGWLGFGVPCSLPPLDGLSGGVHPRFCSLFPRSCIPSTSWDKDPLQVFNPGLGLKVGMCSVPRLLYL